METPVISVVIVNWNRKELLRACLDSLAAQTFTNFETVVVDNGSDDGSAAMVREYALPIRLIENRENKGFCAANNQGFAVSQSEYVALLNNDAEADPGWLDAMLKAIQIKPDVGESDVGMVASKILVWEDPRIIDKCGHLIYPDGQNRGRGHGDLDRGQFDRQEEVLWPDGCAALYRRAMLDEVGGFDEEFFAYADDAELGLRARIAGWSCLYAPGAVVRHHRGATLGLNSAKRLTLIERNRVLLVVKLFPWNLLWANSAYHLARIGGGMAAALRGKGDIRRYPGPKGKLTAATALIKGTLSRLADDPLDDPQKARVPVQTSPQPEASAQAAAAIPDQTSRLVRTSDVVSNVTASSITTPDPCPACGKRESRVLFSATDRLYGTTNKIFRIVECRNCRLIRLDPQPHPLELHDYYPPKYWYTSDTDTADRLEQVYRRFVLRDHLHFVERALRESEETGVVLDVGCGGGLFLQMLAERGVKNVVGLDFSLDAANVAWRRAGVPAICATLSRAPLAPGSCAAVTMFHVLEHLYDPASYLDAAHQLLRPDGRLIIQVPNAACWQFLLLGERWNGIDVPRHLINFRLSDVDSLLDSCGFEVLRHKHFSLRDNPAGLATSLAPTLDPMARRMRQIRETPRQRLMKDLVYMALVLGSIPFTLVEAACRAGSTIMVEARKKS